MGRMLSRYLHFKYSFVKKCRNRVIDFKEKADSPEKEEAWDEVLSWYNSFLDPKYRAFTQNDAIALDLKLDRVDDVLRKSGKEVVT